jgi:hypothetical protein
MKIDERGERGALVAVAVTGVGYLATWPPGLQA